MSQTNLCTFQSVLKKIVNSHYLHFFLCVPQYKLNEMKEKEKTVRKGHVRLGNCTCNSTLGKVFFSRSIYIDFKKKSYNVRIINFYCTNYCIQYRYKYIFNKMYQLLNSKPKRSWWFCPVYLTAFNVQNAANLASEQFPRLSTPFGKDQMLLPHWSCKVQFFA